MYYFVVNIQNVRLFHLNIYALLVQIIQLLQQLKNVTFIADIFLLYCQTIGHGYSRGEWPTEWVIKVLRFRKCSPLSSTISRSIVREDIFSLCGKVEFRLSYWFTCENRIPDNRKIRPNLRNIVVFERTKLDVTQSFPITEQ